MISDTRAVRILVVDDMPLMQNMLCTFFKKMGHEVIVAQDGHEAIRMYQKYMPDLVTMDIMMPHLDGIEAISRIHEINNNASIIVVSVLDELNSINRAIAAGASEYLTKPYSYDEVRDMVNALVPGAIPARP